MFAAWWLPRFPLQALRAPAGQVSGVLEMTLATTAARGDARLLCVSAPAEALGIHAGMTVSQAQARHPRLQVLYRDETAEKAMHDLLLRQAEAWTPDHEATAADLCVLDLTRVRWQDALPWTDRGRIMHQDLRAEGLETRVGIAENPGLASLAAHVADPVRVLRPGVKEEKAALYALPLSVLAPSPEMHAVLHLWGVCTLGQLIKLPRAEIARRLGRDGLALWDAAQGGRERLLKLVRPGQSFCETHELESALECLEPLMRLLALMLRRLCARLAAAWRVAGALLLTLEFADRTGHQRSLRVAEPTCDVQVLERLLQAHLEGLHAAAPIVKIALEITPVRAASRQPTLFERSLKDPNRFAETLSALEALLGKGRAGRAELLPTHQPDAFRVAGFLEPHATVVHAGAVVESSSHGLPLQRFRPPKAAQVLLQKTVPVQLRVDGQTLPLVAQNGPWLLSGGWWDPRQRWQEELWDAAADDGTLYRLASRSGRWSVEGIYH